MSRRIHACHVRRRIHAWVGCFNVCLSSHREQLLSGEERISRRAFLVGNRVLFGCYVVVDAEREREIER